MILCISKQTRSDLDIENVQISNKKILPSQILRYISPLVLGQKCANHFYLHMSFSQAHNIGNEVKRGCFLN